MRVELHEAEDLTGGLTNLAKPWGPFPGNFTRQNFRIVR